MNLTTAVRLISTLTRHPREFWDRLATAWEARSERFRISTPTYELTTWSEIVSGLRVALGVDLNGFLVERQLAEIESHTRQRLQELADCGPFRLQHSADFRLARLCYLVCRALRPQSVVETGVAYGLTTAFILAALETNQRGRLYSVDLPPLGKEADRFIGAVVPENLRARWRLHRGTVKRVLPPLLKEIGRVDIFIHDSLHTYRNMRMEFDCASAFFGETAILISDDVEANPAFAEWVTNRSPSFWAVSGEEEESKRGLFGVGAIVNSGRADHCR